MTKFEILKEYLLRCISVKKNGNKYEMVISNHLTSPSRSSWCKEGNKNCNISLDFRKIFSLANNAEVEVVDFKLVDIKGTDASRFNDFYFYAVFGDRFKDLYKSVLDELSYWRISKSIHYKNKVLFNYGKNCNSELTYMTITSLEKMLAKRVLEVSKYVDKLNANKAAFVPKQDKAFWYFNIQNRKMDYAEFNQIQLDDMGHFFKRKYYSMHRLIDDLAAHFGIVIRDSANFSIDNGWGSYTYTFIRNFFDMDKLTDQQKRIVKYILNYHVLKGLKTHEYERRLEIGSNRIGMVQTSGGYTHVSA
jgi:hypothetical protein